MILRKLKIEMLNTSQKGVVAMATIMVAAVSAVSLEEETTPQVIVFEQPVTIINIGDPDDCDTVQTIIAGETQDEAPEETEEPSGMPVLMPEETLMPGCCKIYPEVEYGGIGQ